MAKRLSKLVGIAALLCGVGYYPAASAFTLITEEEAKLPNGQFQERLRDPFPGPVISVMGCPQEEFTLPIELALQLKGYAGANINMDSLQVIYLKQPRVDLTPRIRNAQLIKASSDQTVSVSFQNAEIPLGEHQILVRAKDSRNKDSETLLLLNVKSQQNKTVWSWTSASQKKSFIDASQRCG